MKKLILLMSLSLSFGAQASGLKCFVHISETTDGNVHVTPHILDLKDTHAVGFEAIGDTLIVGDLKMEVYKMVNPDSRLKLNISKKNKSTITPWLSIASGEVSSLAPNQTILIEGTLKNISAAVSCVGL